MKHNQLSLSHFKIKTPPIQTPELDAFYDVLFKELNAGWAGYGHYTYGDGAAQLQDGFVYLFKRLGSWTMTCDHTLFGKEEHRALIPEMTIAQLSNVLVPKITFLTIG